jgi:hypothetical protein
MYEEHALEKLSKGGDFTATPLLPSDSSASRANVTVTFKKDSRLQSFRNLSDLKDARAGGRSADRIMVPFSDTFAAIDAVLPGQRLANATINTKHNIILFAKDGKEGLVRVAEALGLTKRIQFFWILPRDRYDLAVKAGTPFPLSLGDVDGSSVSAVAAAAPNAGTALPSAVPRRRRGRPAKNADHPLLAKYTERVEQYALLVEFDPVQDIGGSAPNPAT